MKEFLLIFRRDAVSSAEPMSPEQMQAMMKPWQDWMGSLAAQNKFVSQGNQLEPEGMVVKPNNIVTNGPYVEIKEAIGGYIIIRSETIEEAAELAKGCPILHAGGNVEIRPIFSM